MIPHGERVPKEMILIVPFPPTRNAHSAKYTAESLISLLQSKEGILFIMECWIGVLGSERERGKQAGRRKVAFVAPSDHFELN